MINLVQKKCFKLGKKNWYKKFFYQTLLYLILEAVVFLALSSSHLFVSYLNLFVFYSFGFLDVGS